MLSLFAAGLVTLSSLLLVIVRNWKISLGILAFQYIGVFLLVGLEWPITLAFTQLIAGWIAIAIIGMPLLGMTEPASRHPTFQEPDQRLSVVFYLLAVIFIGLVTSSIAPSLTRQLPGIDFQQTWGGLILIGMGLLRLGFTIRPLSIISSLLTVFSGFEVLYTPMDNSPFIAGLFAVTMLGLALTGSYLLVAPHPDEKE